MMHNCIVNDIRVTWSINAGDLNKDDRRVLSIELVGYGKFSLSDNDASDLIFALTRAKRDRNAARRRLKG